MNTPAPCPSCRGTGHRHYAGGRAENGWHFCRRCGGARFVIAESLVCRVFGCAGAVWRRGFCVRHYEETRTDERIGVTTLGEWERRGDALLAPREARAR